MKKKTINMEGVSPESWARTIFLMIALINQVLAVLGKGQIEIAESTIYQICTLIATVISAIMAWWKNNSFSKSAQVADVVMHDLETPIEYIQKANQPDTDHHYPGVG